MKNGRRSSSAQLVPPDLFGVEKIRYAIGPAAGSDRRKVCSQCDGSGIAEDMSGGLIRDCPHCGATGIRTE